MYCHLYVWCGCRIHQCSSLEKWVDKTSCTISNLFFLVTILAVTGANIINTMAGLKWRNNRLNPAKCMRLSITISIIISIAWIGRVIYPCASAETVIFTECHGAQNRSTGRIMICWQVHTAWRPIDGHERTRKSIAIARDTCEHVYVCVYTHAVTCMHTYIELGDTTMRARKRVYVSHVLAVYRSAWRASLLHRVRGPSPLGRPAHIRVSPHVFTLFYYGNAAESTVTGGSIFHRESIVRRLFRARETRRSSPFSFFAMIFCKVNLPVAFSASK